MFVYIRSAAFVIVTQKLVLQQSKNVRAKCTEPYRPLLLFNISLIIIILWHKQTIKHPEKSNIQMFTILGVDRNKCMGGGAKYVFAPPS